MMVVQIARSWSLARLISRNYDPNINAMVGNQSVDTEKQASRRTCHAVCELQLGPP